MRCLDPIRAVFSKFLLFLHKPKRANDVLGRPDLWIVRIASVATESVGLVSASHVCQLQTVYIISGFCGALPPAPHWGSAPGHHWGTFIPSPPVPTLPPNPAYATVVTLSYLLTDGHSYRSKGVKQKKTYCGCGGTNYFLYQGCYKSGV